MVIGKHEPKAARPTSLKQCLAIGLDEALTALEEAFCDLTDEQVWAVPCPGRHHIATIVMHLHHNMDVHACRLQTGELTLKHEERFDIWSRPDPDLPARKKAVPSVSTMLERHRALREAVLAGLERATVVDLLGPGVAAETYWCKEHRRTSADAYARTIWHTMTHVRQIWLLRGLMDLTDKNGWPQQHYH